MKLTPIRRILLALFWLVSVCLFAAAFYARLSGSGFDPIDQTLGGYTNAALITFAVLFIALAVWTLTLIFRRSAPAAEKGFITVDSSDNGKVRMTVAAVEQMVKQAARDVEGVNEMKTSIVNEDDAIDINVSIVLDNGAHVPTVSLNLQRAIRQYVEMNCGVQVRSVPVSILSVMRPNDKVRPLLHKPADADRHVAVPQEQPAAPTPPQGGPTGFEPAEQPAETKSVFADAEPAEEPVPDTTVEDTFVPADDIAADDAEPETHQEY